MLRLPDPEKTKPFRTTFYSTPQYLCDGRTDTCTYGPTEKTDWLSGENTLEPRTNSKKDNGRRATSNYVSSNFGIKT